LAPFVGLRPDGTTQHIVNDFPTTLLAPAPEVRRFTRSRKLKARIFASWLATREATSEATKFATRLAKR
jgi:hypothetical protein